MIGKQVLAFGKREKSELIYIRIFAASSGGRKGRRHIGSFTPDWERSHVCSEQVKQKASSTAIKMYKCFVIVTLSAIILMEL